MCQERSCGHHNLGSQLVKPFFPSNDTAHDQFADHYVQGIFQSCHIYNIYICVICV